MTPANANERSLSGAPPSPYDPNATSHGRREPSAANFPPYVPVAAGPNPAQAATNYGQTSYAPLTPRSPAFNPFANAPPGNPLRYLIGIGIGIAVALALSIVVVVIMSLMKKPAVGSTTSPTSSALAAAPNSDNASKGASGDIPQAVATQGVAPIVPVQRPAAQLPATQTEAAQSQAQLQKPAAPTTQQAAPQGAHHASAPPPGNHRPLPLDANGNPLPVDPNSP